MSPTASGVRPWHRLRRDDLKREARVFRTVTIGDDPASPTHESRRILGSLAVIVDSLMAHKRLEGDEIEAIHSLWLGYAGL